MYIILLTPGFPQNSHQSKYVIKNTQINSQQYIGPFNEMPFWFSGDIAQSIFKILFLVSLCWSFFPHFQWLYISDHWVLEIDADV